MCLTHAMTISSRQMAPRLKDLSVKADITNEAEAKIWLVENVRCWFEIMTKRHFESPLCPILMLKKRN